MAQKKAKNAAAKGKVFSLHAKLITLAAQRGGDPGMNPALAEAIAKAKKDNVPSDNIDRAIKKGVGDAGASKMEQIIYEGYAPGGVALVVRCLTDNRNRTAPNMRHIFSHYGGSLSETGAVTGFAYDHLGVIDISGLGSLSQDQIEECIIESGADDYQIDGNEGRVFTARAQLASVMKALSAGPITIESAALGYRPKLWNEVESLDNAVSLRKMEIELEEDEDVEEIWHNADISAQMAQDVEARLEASKFRI